MTITVHVCTGPTYSTYRSPAGFTHQYIAGFLVVATARDGRRWQHERTFATEDSAGQLVERILAAGAQIDPAKTCWYAVEPVYGSVEYQRQNCEELWVQREREDARAGF